MCKIMEMHLLCRCICAFDHGPEFVNVHLHYTLHEWYNFVRGTPGNDISDVTGKKLERNMVFGHFS